MRRYPMFDPPEYVEWRPDADITEEFAHTARRDPERRALIEALTAPQLLGLYAGMLRFRLHDITLKRWVRQGVLSKAWLGTGEEALTVGNVHALNRACDLVGPMIRNAGACHEMGIPVVDMLRASLATGDSPSWGKDLHFGDLARGVIAPTSQVAALSPVVAGVALAFKIRNERRVVLTWIGDGATKTTAFHEGMNLAATLGAPAIYVLQNNQIALGTRLDQHQRGPFAAWARAYGVRGFTCDGNNVLDCFAATRLAADLARAGKGPVILCAETFRMGGHATHDEREAREIFSPDLFQHWGKRDPIGMFEIYLQKEGIPRKTLEKIEERAISELAQAESDALASREAHPPDPRSTLDGVRAD